MGLSVSGSGAAALAASIDLTAVADAAQGLILGAFMQEAGKKGPSQIVHKGDSESENTSNGDTESKDSSASDWYNPDGSKNYPPNDGAVPGTEKNITLRKGETFGRYGDIQNDSKFVTQTGADASKLSLPPDTDSSIYQEFIVLKDIPDTIQAEIAPWGGSEGGGIQYKLPAPIL